MRTIVSASKVASLVTACITSWLFVKSTGKSFLVMKTRIIKMMPINSEVKVTTTTENFAAFGCPAPSSFDTLTLRQNKPITNIFERIVTKILNRHSLSSVQAEKI